MFSFLYLTLYYVKILCVAMRDREKKVREKKNIRQTDRHTQADRQTDRQTYRQTERRSRDPPWP